VVIETGDIVLGQSGLRYVVADFFGAPEGGQMARLIRRTKTGSFASFARHADELNPFERPSFEPGDPVVVNELRGGYLGTEHGRSRVLLAERRKPLFGGGFIVLDAAVVRPPLWMLVLENQL